MSTDNTMKKTILAAYPNDYSMDDYRENVKADCDFGDEIFDESMVTDDGFYSFCANQNDFDAECFLDELTSELKKTRIKEGFLEIHNGGWQQQHGMTPVFDIDAAAVVSKLLSVGDATIEMYKIGHKLGFMRYSHDEPAGARITLHSKKDSDRVHKEIFNN
jgi:hypothetical protein